MFDAEFDLDELDLEADLDENDENPLDSDENPKLLFEDINLPLDILARVPICRLFWPFCSLSNALRFLPSFFTWCCGLPSCSRRAVGNDESGSWITPQMWWPRHVSVLNVL